MRSTPSRATPPSHLQGLLGPGSVYGPRSRGVPSGPVWQLMPSGPSDDGGGSSHSQPLLPSQQTHVLSRSHCPRARVSGTNGSSALAQESSLHAAPGLGRVCDDTESLYSGSRLRAASDLRTNVLSSRCSRDPPPPHTVCPTRRWGPSPVPVGVPLTLTPWSVITRRPRPRLPGCRAAPSPVGCGALTCPTMSTVPEPTQPTGFSPPWREVTPHH